MSQETIKARLTDYYAKLVQLEKAYAIGFEYSLTITKQTIDRTKAEIKRLEQLINN